MSFRVSSNFKKYSISIRTLYPSLYLSPTYSNTLSKLYSKSFDIIVNIINGYPNRSNNIPPSNFESFNKRATIHTNPDQLNNKYKVKYNFVIVLLIKGCLSKKLESKKILRQKVIRANAILCLIN